MKLVLKNDKDVYHFSRRRNNNISECSLVIVFGNGENILPSSENHLSIASIEGCTQLYNAWISIKRLNLKLCRPNF